MKGKQSITSQENQLGPIVTSPKLEFHQGRPHKYKTVSISSNSDTSPKVEFHQVRPHKYKTVSISSNSDTSPKVEFHQVRPHKYKTVSISSNSDTSPKVEIHQVRPHKYKTVSISSNSEVHKSLSMSIFSQSKSLLDRQKKSKTNKLKQRKAEGTRTNLKQKDNRPVCNFFFADPMAKCLTLQAMRQFVQKSFWAIPSPKA